MKGDEDSEYWEQLVTLLRQEPINRIIFTLAGGTKLIVQDVLSMSFNRHALQIYLSDGSVQLFQVALIACTDVLFDEED